MPMVRDEEQESREQQYELQRLAATERDNQNHRRHEENKLRLQLELANARKRSVTRTEAAQRVLIAFLKAWTVPFAFGLIWAYMKRNKAVPEFLTDYLNL